MANIRFIDRQTGEEKIETPPGEGFLKFLYDHPLGKLPLELLAKRKFLSAWYGRQMDKPSSVNRIQGFVDQLGIDMSESIKSVEEFSSFNDFFYRKLKPEARPIQEDFVSPGDGKLIAFERISDLGNFFVKGEEFSLRTFLNDNSLADRFKHAALLILRLAPNDYHRFHFPYAGMASALHMIEGDYLSVSPYALAANFVRVFCQNKRAFTLLETSDKGEILLCPVGATMVGSILTTYAPDTVIQKGDEMGYFAFGGSSMVILVDKEKVKIDSDILENSRNGNETFVKMGERIGN